MSPTRNQLILGVAWVLLLPLAGAAGDGPATRAVGGWQTERGAAERRSHDTLTDYLPNLSKRQPRPAAAVYRSDIGGRSPARGCRPARSQSGCPRRRHQIFKAAGPGDNNQYL